MEELPFAKGHGLGNDYLVVERSALPWPLTTRRIQAICDRHHGIGSDGVLIADLDDGFAIRIYNPDGSEAEKSGNGLRIFGAWVYGRGLVALNDWFDVRLVKDTVRMRIEQELEGGALLIRVELGRASFRAEDAGFVPATGDVRDHHLDLGDGSSALVNPVSLANPHCVVFVEAHDRADFERRSPRICTSPAFPAGTNVQFAQVIDARTLDIRIWERGAGETLASGSSASAAAAAAVGHGYLQPGLITIRMPGGTAEVEVTADFDVILCAPAQVILTGVVRGAVAAAW